MKKTKNISFSIPVDIFGCQLLVFVGSPKGCVDFLRKKGCKGCSVEKIEEQLDSGSTAFTVALGGGNALVYTQQDLVKYPEILVHELCHVSCLILTYFEIEEQTPYNEVFAYLTGYLFRESMKYLKRRGK